VAFSGSVASLRRGPARIRLGVGAALGALAVVAVMHGAAHAATAPSTSLRHGAAIGAASRPTCVVHSLPAFVAQGEFELEATVGDIIEVECNPYVYATGSRIKITASELYDRCHGALRWYDPDPYEEVAGERGISVPLDADGNATVAVLAGPGCHNGESLVTAHMEEAPFETFTTSFAVLPPANTPPGVFAMPDTQVEDAHSSSVATIIEAEYRNASEQPVRFASEELYARCRSYPKLRWILMNGEIREGVSEVNGIRLDNNGNAFVILLGTSSCAEGTSMIESDLEVNPFTTPIPATFTILPPQPTEEPAFTIEKQQEVGGSGFTAAPLTGLLGETVHYRILVKNTAEVPETLGSFTDPHCDAGTIAGGPGAEALAPGATATFTCSHVLTEVGVYTNQASVTATTAGGTPLTETSNLVEVNVPVEVAFTIEKAQEIAGAGGGFTTATLTGAIGQTVDYQITVKNTGNVPFKLSTFTDAPCDQGTITGGPGEATVPPKSSTTYTCSRLLTGAGIYTNQASVTATAEGVAPLAQGSNQVKAEVPETTNPKLVPKPQCTQRPGPLHGASGSKRGTFTVSINSSGIARITFFLDGRKLKTLKASQARHGKFTIKVNARALRVGKHKLTAKVLMQSPYCPAEARTAVFVRPAASGVKAEIFTG
jgi:uncharacterized repeat protein (TIGR01451 family)